MKHPTANREKSMQQPAIDFLKYRFVCFLFSVSLLASLPLLIYYKQTYYGSAFNYALEFTGGAQVLFKFERAVAAEEIQQALINKGWTGVAVRTFLKSEEVEIRLKTDNESTAEIAAQVQHALEEQLPQGGTVTLLASEHVGPAIAQASQWKWVRAVAYTLAVLAIYMFIRFKSIGFALGAIIALIHDILVMLLIFLLLGREISLNFVAAVLTVLGYSINDTIIVFARIRDNLQQNYYQPLYDLVNNSLNVTLRRTILTSAATALVVCCLLVVGGEALRDFALALLVGIVFGTYSSIYIASPVMMLFDRRK